MGGLATLITFWRKREPRSATETERIIPLPNLARSTLEASQFASTEAVSRAREALRLLKLERQILGSAVTTIYESQTKGIITETERDSLLEKYKVDLKRLDKTIEENQQVVDVHDLVLEREEIDKNYKAKLAEIDARLKELRSGARQNSLDPIPQSHKLTKIANSSVPVDPIRVHETVAEIPVKEREDEQITDAEKRIEKIRAEILQAMDRLEQIEPEG